MMSQNFISVSVSSVPFALPVIEIFHYCSLPPPPPPSPRFLCE